MKKRILYTLAAASLFAAAASVTAASFQESGSFSATSALKAEGTEEVLTPKDPELTGECKIEGRNLYISLTVKAPTQARNSDWQYIDVAKFTKLALYRQDSWSEPAKLLQEWQDVDAEATFPYDDKDPTLVKGTEYIYYAVATLGTNDSSRTYAYVTLEITPVTPEQPTLEPTGIVAPVTVRYTCPALEQSVGYSGTAPLPESVTYEKIVLSKKFNGRVTELESHDNPTPGQAFEFIDNDAPNGNNTYLVQTFTFAGNSEQSSATIWLGYDYPTAPSNVTAVEVDGKVKVTWTAPSRGFNYGTLDPKSVRYTVYRMKSSYDQDPKLMADDVIECEYIDDIADLTSEQTVYYKVVAYNDIEAPANTYNYASTDNGLVVGPPSQLPFHETFNAGTKFDKKHDYLWQSEFPWDSFSDYYLRYDQSVEVGGEAPLKMPAGVDGGTEEDETGPDAFLYVTAASYYDKYNEGYMTSSKLTLANITNPYAMFYYVPINNSTGTVSLQVWKGDVDENGDPVWDNVQTVSYDDPELDESAVTTELKWTKVMVPLTAYAGTEMCKIRLVFQYAEPKDHRYPMLFDDIRIEDYPAPVDLAVARADNGDLNVTWVLSESAGEKDVEYNVYLDGEKVATTTETSYTHTAVEQGESYTFEVEAVYADGITTAKTEPVTFDVELTSFTVDDMTYFVNGEDVTALRYEGTAESVTIPATVEYKELSFNVTEMSTALFKGNRTLKSATIEAPFTEIPAESFYGCVELSEVTMPATVTKIGDKAFFGCAKLEAITLPDALATIGASAFEHSGLKSISFGENLTSIGAGAFRYCAALAEVTFATAVPPTVGEEAFAEIADPCWGGCPAGSIEAYQAEPNLSTITFRLAGVDGIQTGNGVARTEYFNTAGERIAAPQQGVVTIVRTTYANGKVTTKKILNK